MISFVKDFSDEIVLLKSSLKIPVWKGNFRKHEFFVVTLTSFDQLQLVFSIFISLRKHHFSLPHAAHAPSIPSSGD